MLSRDLLVAWSEFDADHEQDVLDWHTAEHLPERMSIPGFLRARRYADVTGGSHRHFILYELADAGVLASPAYRARLNDPSAWTVSVQRYFRANVRAACLLTVSTDGPPSPDAAVLRFAGGGVRGAVERSVLRWAAASRGRQQGRGTCEGPGVGLHVGWLASPDGGLANAEAVLRGDSGVIPFDGMVLVEGDGRARVEAAAEGLSQVLCAVPGMTTVDRAAFRLAADITAPA